MILKRYGYFLLLWLSCFVPGVAQTTYPVQVNVHMLPPYSLYLSDYYSGTRERLTVTLINRDQLKPTVNVRLRMIITAPGGIRLQTNDNVPMQPLAVDAGMPVRLTQEDLSPYFQPSNLITQGYLAAGKLPEGMVEFCFQAVEAYTGQVLSTSSCTRAWITSQKPPLLSLPRNNESVAFRDPLNVMFQWTPMHQGLAQVEYDFILKELWDNGMTTQAAFPYSPEIYRETVRSTSIIYGALQPPLLPGKRYAWCVRARAREGVDEVNVFQNDGYSEIRTFTLQDNCAPPDYVQAAAERKRINLEWNMLPQFIGFTVGYRIKSEDGKTQAEWKEQQTQEAKMSLYGLQSGATYEYRVASMCIAGQPVYSPIFTIAIPNTDSARLAQCGILPEVNLANQEPIKELKTAEEFKAGDFPITITRFSGSNGIFSGEGWTIIPWLNDAKVAVEFKDITINTDRQMINGFVEAKYDKTEGQIANLDDVFEGGFDVGNVKTGLTKIDYKFDFTIPGVSAFALSDAGDLVITDSEGAPHTVTPQDKEGQGNEGNKVVVFPMTVQDKNGDVYQVEKVTETDPVTGKSKEVAKATYVGKAGAPLAEGSFDPTQLNGDKAIVTFNKGTGYYAFDTWQDYYDKISLIKGKYEKLYIGYYAPWKLLPAGKTDKVSATIEIKDQSIKPEQVIFKTPKGTEYKAEYANGTYTFQVVAGPEGDVQELYALYPKGGDKYYTLGKLGIATYAAQTQEVVLVSVNNVPVDKDEIDKTLQEIYGVTGVKWTVSKDDFTYDGNYRLMDNSTGLSTYNEAMRNLNNAYRAARPSFSKTANYLFFLKATGSDNVNNRDLTGFMPRGEQFGYIFTSEIKDEHEPTMVAHELGHGRWKLYHPFDKHYGGFDEAKLTTNLLAYGNGKQLAKWQWDQMNDPALLVSIFEGDNRSQHTGITVIPDIFWNKDNQATLTFVSPAGGLVVLPNKVRDLIFAHGFENLDGSYVATGTLLGFTLDSISYATSPISLRTFAGYMSADNGKYKYAVSEENVGLVTANALMVLPCDDAINIYQFSATGLKLEDDDPREMLDEKAFPLKPFSSANKIIKTKPYAVEEFAQLVEGDDHRFVVTDYENEMISTYCGKPELLPALKLAQLRNVYPTMFSDYEARLNGLQFPEMAEINEKCASVFKRVWDSKGTAGDYDYLTIAAQGFREYVTIRQQLNENLRKNLSVEKTTIAQLNAILTSFGISDYQRMSLDERILMLRIATKGIIASGEMERAVRNIVTYTPDEDQVQMLTRLRTEKDGENEKFLLFALCEDWSGLDGDEFTATVVAIVDWVRSHYPVPANFLTTVLGNEDPAKNKIIPFEPGLWLGDVLTERFTKDGKVILKARTPFTGSTITVEADAYEYVLINMGENYDVGSRRLLEGSKQKMPALFGYLLFNNENTSRLIKTGKIALDVTLFAVGVGEIRLALAAGKSWRYYRAIVDVGVSITDFAITNVFESSLKQSPRGQAFLGLWNEVTLYYGVASVTEAVLQNALNNLRKQADEIITDGKLLDEKGNVVRNLTDADVDELNKAVDDVETKTGLKAARMSTREVFLARLDQLGFSKLKVEVSKLDDLIQNRFAEHFLGSSDDMLKLMDKEVTLIDDWKSLDTEAQKTFARGFDLIEEHRLIETLPGFDGNTIAFSIMPSGTPVFGYNSGITPALQSSEKAIRERWFSLIDWSPKTYTRASDAQVLWHGEAHSIIRAKESVGTLPDKLIVFVDRRTCNMCVGQIEWVLKGVGVKELKIIQWKDSDGLVLESRIFKAKQ